MHCSTGITTHDGASSALPMLSSIINNNILSKWYCTTHYSCIT